MKTENSKATSGNEETWCHYQAQLIFLGSCPMGLNSLYSRGWFQLTCCEYPKWVTAVNSMSAICCPLGHFWTAAGLRCQLLTGNMAGLTQFQKGERGRKREGEDERENTHASSQKKTDNSVFSSIDHGANAFWRSKSAKSSLSPSLFCLLLFYSWSWVRVLYWNYLLMWKLAECKMSLHSHFFRHIHHIIFQTQKWIFPLL